MISISQSPWHIIQWVFIVHQPDSSDKSLHIRYVLGFFLNASACNLKFITIAPNIRVEKKCNTLKFTSRARVALWLTIGLDCKTRNLTKGLHERQQAVNPTPTVSVLLPVYHAERFTARVLDSMFAQTFEDFELLALDDGSTDLPVLANSP